MYSGAFLLGLDPSTEVGQRLPAGVARTHIAGAGLSVAIFTAARAKSLAVGLAQCFDRQGQKHLLSQHILKRKTVSLIITDFRLRRSNGAFRRPRIRSHGPINEVKVGAQRNLHRLHAARAGNLKSAGKAALEPDVGHNLPGTAVLVQHLGMAGGSQASLLLGLLAQIDRTWSQLQIKIYRFPFQFADYEFHSLSLRRKPQPVNRAGRRDAGTAHPSNLCFSFYMKVLMSVRFLPIYCTSLLRKGYPYAMAAQSPRLLQVYCCFWHRLRSLHRAGRLHVHHLPGYCGQEPGCKRQRIPRRGSPDRCARSSQWGAA